MRITALAFILLSSLLRAEESVRPPAPPDAQTLGQGLVMLDTKQVVPADDPHALLYEAMLNTIVKYYPEHKPRQVANMCLVAQESLAKKINRKMDIVLIMTHIIRMAPTTSKVATLPETIATWTVMVEHEEKSQTSAKSK